MSLRTNQWHKWFESQRVRLAVKGFLEPDEASGDGEVLGSVSEDGHSEEDESEYLMRVFSAPHVAPQPDPEPNFLIHVWTRKQPNS